MDNSRCNKTVGTTVATLFIFRYIKDVCVYI